MSLSKPKIVTQSTTLSDTPAPAPAAAGADVLRLGAPNPSDDYLDDPRALGIGRLRLRARNRIPEGAVGVTPPGSTAASTALSSTLGVGSSATAGSGAAPTGNAISSTQAARQERVAAGGSANVYGRNPLKIGERRADQE